MKRTQGQGKILTLCFVAMFAALICACTFISIPLPFGYFNLGDVVMLLGAFILGFPAAISATIGASLADVLMGYTIYAPLIFRTGQKIQIFRVVFRKNFKKLQKPKTTKINLKKIEGN